MADYKVPGYRPAVDGLRMDFTDQSESVKYLPVAEKILSDYGLDKRALLLNCIAFLYKGNNISELTEFMSFLRSHFNLGERKISDNKIYNFAKGIPALSDGKIGYTFRRKHGLFFFLVAP